MKIALLGNLAAEPQRSLLVGTYQGHEIRTFASGGGAEQYSLLVGKRVIDVTVFLPKGVAPTAVKPPVWPVGAKVVAVDVSIEAGEYGLQARAKSCSILE